MILSPQGPHNSYLATVQQLAQSQPSLKPLYEFLNNTGSQSPTQISIVTIGQGPPGDIFSTKHIEGCEELGKELQENHTSISKNSCLFIVENICPDTVILLGERFNIDPQAFADHVNHTSWFRINDVADSMPALPSSQKLDTFLQLRYIEMRKVLNVQCPIAAAKADTSDAGYDGCFRDGDLFSLSRSFVRPVETATRVPRKAGKFIPRARQNQKFPPLLCVRQVITAWFKKKGVVEEGWVGILLVDPPFKLPEGGSQCLPPEYRSFIRQHESPNANPVQNLPESNREAIVQFLEKRLNENTKLLAEARNDSFLILGDVYRLVASCWMVVNEYINRELATIEDILEKEDPEFHDLKVYLKDLYIHRRRCARYDELIGKAKQQCTNHGQQAWPKLCSSSLVVEHAQDLENDFGYLQARTQGTISRIEKNMSLLTSLVAIGEGEQGLDENHDIARLSFVATILLPFTTVGTIMGMQGSHAPGSSGFWVFWVVAVLLTLGVLGLFSVYDFAYPLFRRLVGKLFIFVGSVFRRWGHKKLGRTNE